MAGRSILTTTRTLFVTLSLGISLFSALPAQAENGAVNLHLEPQIAVMLAQPQNLTFGLGRGVGARLDLDLAGGLALQAGLTFLDFPLTLDPTGPALATSGRLLGLSVGGRWRPGNDRPGWAGTFGGPGGVGDSFFGNLWIDAELSLIGTGDLARFGFSAGAGVEFSLRDGLQLGPFVRYGQVVQQNGVLGLNEADAMMVVFGLSVSAAFGDDPRYTADDDQDGLRNLDDQCPDDAEDLDGFEDEDGCPELDNDQDTLPDTEDRCPNEAGPTVNGGCPDKDKDGDGLVDRIDLCPDDLGTPVNKGCPGEDSDGDGLVDSLDKCPEVPGPAMAEGCPEPDTDGDGFLDKLDECPEEPEVFNGIEDDDGCPDEGDALVVLTENQIEIRKKVAFDESKVRFGSAAWRVDPGSYLMLATVAKILFLHPELELIRIEGHTDDRGKREFNLKLSKKRAEAVRRHLVKVNGVEGHRLEAAGRAFDEPVAGNDTPAGRARNRRVEFRIVRRSRRR